MSARGICPVCNGSLKDSEGRPCRNCGGQYMFGTARGDVRLREDGTPCTHSYTSKTVGRCLTEYTCTHCGDRFQIDSGD